MTRDNIEAVAREVLPYFRDRMPQKQDAKIAEPAK
jgi:hypothetical protein